MILQAFQCQHTVMYYAAADLQRRCPLHQFKGGEAFPGEVQTVTQE